MISPCEPELWTVSSIVLFAFLINGRNLPLNGCLPVAIKNNMYVSKKLFITVSLVIVAILVNRSRNKLTTSKAYALFNL